jgi:hypothetical protein
VSTALEFTRRRQAGASGTHGLLRAGWIYSIGFGSTTEIQKEIIGHSPGL